MPDVNCYGATSIGAPQRLRLIWVSAVEQRLRLRWAAILTDRRLTPDEIASLRLRPEDVCQLEFRGVFNGKYHRRLRCNRKRRVVADLSDSAHILPPYKCAASASLARERIYPLALLFVGLVFVVGWIGLLDYGVRVHGLLCRTRSPSLFSELPFPPGERVEDDAKRCHV